MAVCSYHPYIEETQPCAACGRPFCENCLTVLGGRQLCPQCKPQAVERMVGGTPEAKKPRHPLVVAALVVPLVGYVIPCVVPITSPIGLYLGRKTLREIREDPRYSGRSAALAGMVVSGGTLVAFLLGVVAVLVGWIKR